MKYKGVSLPLPLVNEVDKIVEKGADGYTSRAEFIACCIREKVKREKSRNIDESK
jgi:metal-responsive CopG/Arc/MetJ family transcriptional regulator